MEYRIKEQFGVFLIEKKLESEREDHTFLTKWLPFLFKPKKIKTTLWLEISNNGQFSGIFFKSIRLKTIKEAEQTILNLTPKYHLVNKV